MESPIKTIVKRQLSSYFTSPVAYTFIVMFLLLSALMTWLFGRLYEEPRIAHLAPFFVWTPWILSILVPALTMGLWAEERRSNTIELLLTLPTSTRQAVLGKFIAAWIMLLVVILATTPIVVTIAMLGDPDNGHVWGGYIGMILLAGSYLAIGLFASAITKSQVVGFIVAVVACILFVFAGFGPITDYLYGFLPGSVVTVIANLSSFTHYSALQKGVIEPLPVCYFLSSIAFFLFLTMLATPRSVEKDQVKKTLTFGLNMTLFVALVFIGIFIVRLIGVMAFGDDNMNGLITSSLISGLILLVLTFVFATLINLLLVFAGTIKGTPAKWLAGAVVLLLLICMNAVLSSTDLLRKDMTEGKLFTLSDSTEQILTKLKDSTDASPVTLKYFFSRGAKDIPQQLKDYGNRVQNLLEQYEDKGGDMVFLEVYNPKPFTEEEELAQKYNLGSARAGNDMDVDPFFCGLVVTSGKKEEAIPFFQAPAPGQPETLEYDVSKLVAEVARNKPPKIGVLSSLPVFGSEAPAMPPQMMQQQPPQQPKWFFIDQLERMFDVEEIPTDAKAIPDDISVLVVIHPKGLSDDILFAMDQFVLGGGKLVGFVDPYSYAETLSQPQNNPMARFGSGGSDLNKLTEAWGLSFKSDKIVGDIESYSQQFQQKNLGLIDIKKAQFDESAGDSAALRDLQSLMFFWGGGFDITETEGVTATPLFSSSGKTVGLDGFRALAPINQVMNDVLLEPSSDPADDTSKLVVEGAQTLAVRLTGNLPTAFPGGSPDGSNTNALKNGEGLVVLVGDSDGLIDQFAVQYVNMFGQRRAMPTGSLNFPLGLIEESSGDTALLSLRNRGNFVRRLVKVDDIEAKAREEQQAVINKINNEIRTAQAELDQIKPPEGENRQLFLNQELKKKEAEVNIKIRQAQKDLRNAEKERLSGVRQLGERIKAIHMGLIPLLVALFGAFVCFIRYARSNRRTA